jgi:predicted O-methyltransferase YrrM
MLSTVKRAIGRNALLRNVIVETTALVERGRIRGLIDDLKNHGDPIAGKLAQGFSNFAVSNPIESQTWAQNIEALRANMLGNTSMLATGNLGAPGGHDEGQRICDVVAVSKSARAAKLLMDLCAALAPKSIVEMGTNVGVSSAYIAAGQRISKVSDPELTTLEFSPYRAEIAKKLHADLNFDHTKFVLGDFNETLAPLLQTLPSLDLAFIDGNHKYKPTLKYTDMILDATQNDIVLIYDDIRWSDGMEKAWLEIMHDPRFSVTVDLNAMGIAVRSSQPHPAYRSHRIRSLAA